MPRRCACRAQCGATKKSKPGTRSACGRSVPLAQRVPKSLVQCADRGAQNTHWIGARSAGTLDVKDVRIATKGRVRTLLRRRFGQLTLVKVSKTRGIAISSGSPQRDTA